jgi:hypothetical protein
MARQGQGWSYRPLYSSSCLTELCQTYWHLVLVNVYVTM